MRWVIVVAAVWAGEAEAARVCQAPPVGVSELAGRNPREVRALLQPVLGPPLFETNQLSDGGTFAKLVEADAQDGVSQRYAWGGDSGSADITFMHGRATTVELHLNEFETAHGEQVLTACQSWPRDRIAAAAGFKLPRQSSSGAHRLFRYELGHGTIARARCNEGSARGLCTAISVYLPAERRPASRDPVVVQATPRALRRVLQPR